MFHLLVNIESEKRRVESVERKEGKLMKHMQSVLSLAPSLICTVGVGRAKHEEVEEEDLVNASNDKSNWEMLNTS